MTTEATTKKPRRAHCIGCGVDLGPSTSCFREIESCGEPECDREARDTDRAEREDAQERAREDDWGRYR
jgi:hypothetical protein